VADQLLFAKSRERGNLPSVMSPGVSGRSFLNHGLDMDFHYLLDLVLHPTAEQLTAILNQMGDWIYLIYPILFLVIFCETGLVVTPFLPGDSLLFAIGVVTALSPVLSLPLFLVILIIAAILGDAVNYWIGYRVGPRIFTSESSWMLNKKHLVRAQEFYDKYGGKAIVLARFVPIVRTFAPFVAGIGKMNYRRFAMFNVIGAVIWVTLCTCAGYFFSGVDLIKNNLHLVSLVIVLISVVPIVIEYILARRKKAAELTNNAVTAQPK
jgi:membrane-associated protein